MARIKCYSINCINSILEQFKLSIKKELQIVAPFFDLLISELALQKKYYPKGCSIEILCFEK
jgi:hypothetical protein